MNPENDEKISGLYQQIEKEQPSELLDARIRQAARKHAPVKSKSKMIGWLSTAALLVLSVGLVLRVMQEAPVTQDFVEQSDISQQPSIPAPTASKPAPEQAPAGFSMGQPKLQEETASYKAEKEVMLDALVSEKKKSRLKALAEPVNWCGQADLQNQLHKSVWQQRIQQLREQDNEPLAQCLEALMAEMIEAGKLK